MIEHLRGRDRKLEPLGWTGRDAEWIALVCLHSGVFTRAQFCDYFGMWRSGAQRFVKSLVERRAAVEGEWPLLNGEGRRAAYRATRSTGRWASRTSATGERPPRRLSCGGFCRWILFWNIRV